MRFDLTARLFLLRIWTAGGLFVASVWARSTSAIKRPSGERYHSVNGTRRLPRT